MSAANPSPPTTTSKPAPSRAALLRFLAVLWCGLLACLVPLAVSPPVTGFAGVDFAQDYFAARWVLQGDSMYRPLEVEQQPPIFQHDVPRIPVRSFHPPFVTLLSLPLGLIPDYAWALQVMGMLNMLLYLWLWFLVLRELVPGVKTWQVLLSATLMLVWYPFVAEFAQGQWSTLLALGVVGCWRALRREREWAAGVLLGMACLVKLFPALLLPLLLLRGRWKTALVACATFAAGTLLTVGLFGWEDTRLFYAELSPLNTAVTGSFPTNIALTGFVLRFFTGGIMARGANVAPFPSLPVALVANGVVVLALLWLAWRRPRSRQDDELVLALGMIGMIVVSPASWVHAYLILLPVLVGLALRASPTRRPVLVYGLMFVFFANAIPLHPALVDLWRSMTTAPDAIPFWMLQLGPLSLFVLAGLVWHYYRKEPSPAL